MNILGVVICGGQSTRMGSDKGLLLKDGKYWAAIIAEKLKGLGMPIVFSINKEQEIAYKNALSGESFVIDQFDMGGPMNGLLSVHAQKSNHDILLIACDMIDMQPAILSQLVNAYETDKSFDYYAFEVEKVVQPFAAIYKNTALADLLSRYKDQTLNSSSLRYTIEHGNTCRLQTTSGESFTNYNTLDERKS